MTTKPTKGRASAKGGAKPPGPEARRADEAEVARLLEPHAARLPDPLPLDFFFDEEALVYEGKTVVDGNFEVGAAPVVVLGDLEVRGHIVDAVDVDRSLLVVVGSVQAENIVTSSEIAITGDVTAGFVYGNSLGDCRFSVAGGVKARSLISHGHWFEVRGTITAEAKIGADSTASLPAPEYEAGDLRDVLVGAVLDGDDIDFDRIRKALLSGKDIFKKGHVPPAERALRLVEKAIKGKSPTALELDDKKLRAFPTALARLTELRTLSLQSNEIPRLPEEIGALTALEELDLEDNSLLTLPPAIGKLTSLRKLNLDLNCVSTLPDEFAALAALEELDLGMNTSLKTEEVPGAVPMTEVPPPILALPRLRVLDLSQNQLTHLPPEFARLEVLEELDLSANQFAVFPEVLRRLPRLKRLSIGYQEPLDDNGTNEARAAFLEGVFQLDGLEALRIDRLALEVLPESIGRLRNLKSLDLSFNKLKRLPDAFFELKELRELRLQYVYLDDASRQRLAEALPECKLLP